MTAIEKHVAAPVAVPDKGELGHIMEVVRSISTTDFVPKSLRGNNAAILACILTGRGLGLDPMHALRSIHIVDGKATLSAELMVTLARRAGHSITAEYGDGQVTVKGRRGDNGDEMTVTWTMAMAQRAGLVGKDNWKKYPESMLWARGVSQLCRMLFADVLAGVAYTPDEVELSEEERVSAAIETAVPVDDGVPDEFADFELEGEVVE